MAALNFKKQNDLYISDEVQVDGDFNLHLERANSGIIAIQQRTAGEQFVDIDGSRALHDLQNIDVDVQCIIPKTVRVISHTEVVQAIITV